MNSTDDIIELADTELAAAAHRVYDAGRVAGWTATDYDAAIGWTKVGSPTWDVLYEARRKLRQLPDVEHEPADGWVLFFDGSKSDDSTALVGCRLSDGHVVTLGIWAKPQGARGVGWIVPRTEVDERVRHVLDVWDVKALWADPSHAKDDDSTSYWQAIIDGWHQDYGRSLVLWAVAGGPNKHSTMWDMASPKRVEAFTAAAEQAEADLRSSAEVMAAGDAEGRTVTHDNHPALVAHLKHARRSPNRYGVSVWKGHRESSRKIDLAVCLIGARMLRRQFLNTTATRKTGKQAGRAW